LIDTSGTADGAVFGCGTRVHACQQRAREHAEEDVDIYLYYIPLFTYVPITLSLIERLLMRYPTVVAGAMNRSGF
jgi:dihydrodipicolinate synthase/N-acetylneuraminate lyase